MPKNSPAEVIYEYSTRSHGIMVHVHVHSMFEFRTSPSASTLSCSVLGTFINNLLIRAGFRDKVDLALATPT